MSEDDEGGNREISVRITTRFNAMETVLIDRLVESGLYGSTRNQAVKKLVDERLMEVWTLKPRRK